MDYRRRKFRRLLDGVRHHVRSYSHHQQADAAFLLQ